MLHIMKKYVLPRIKVRALLSEGILDQLGCTIVSKDGTRVVYDKANKCFLQRSCNKGYTREK